MAFFEQFGPELAASARGIGQGLLSQTFTRAPQTGFEGLGAGLGFAEQNIQALRRRQLAQQQAEALEQQRQITNAQNQQRIGISQTSAEALEQQRLIENQLDQQRIGISQGGLGVSEGNLAVSQEKQKILNDEAARKQEFNRKALEFMQGGQVAPPPQTPPPQTPPPGPLSQAVPQVSQPGLLAQAAPQIPQPGLLAQAAPQIPQQEPLAPQPPLTPPAPPGQILSDVNPDILQTPGAQLAGLTPELRPQNPVSPAVPEITAVTPQGQQIAQVVAPKPHPNPEARVAQAQEPTLLGMTRGELGPYMQLKASGNETGAEAYRQNLIISKDKALLRANPSKKDRWAAEDRAHLAFRRMPNVSNFANSIATYNDMLVQSADPSGQADLAMIIGTAKIFDPPGVVREGEVALQKGAGGLRSWIQGWAGFLASGHRLTRADKANLLRITHSRITQYRLAAEKTAVNARATATRRGLEPKNVVRNQFGPDLVAPAILEKDIHPDVVDILDATGNEGKPEIFPSKVAPKARRIRTPQTPAKNAVNKFLDTLRQVQ